MKVAVQTSEGRKHPQQQQVFHIPSHSGGDYTGWTCSGRINNTHLMHLSCPQLAVDLQSRCPGNHVTNKTDERLDLSRRSKQPLRQHLQTAHPETQTRTVCALIFK